MDSSVHHCIITALFACICVNSVLIDIKQGVCFLQKTFRVFSFALCPQISSLMEHLHKICIFPHYYYHMLFMGIL